MTKSSSTAKITIGFSAVTTVITSLQTTTCVFPGNVYSLSLTLVIFFGGLIAGLRLDGMINRAQFVGLAVLTLPVALYFGAAFDPRLLGAA